MPTNNFKLFDENKSNILTDTEYNANTQRLNGVQSGIASSKLNNKFAYQTSLVAYAIAQIMNANGQNASDSDAVATFVANLQGSLVQKVVDCATSAEAVAGVINNKFITPATMKAAALLLSGGTLTGPLILAGDPTLPLHAATKQYVDGAVENEKDNIGDLKSSIKDNVGNKYLLCDGSVINASEYPELYNIIKNSSFDTVQPELVKSITFTPADSSTTSISYNTFIKVNNLYFIIGLESAGNSIVFVTDNIEGNWKVRKFNEKFVSWNISYCNGYYVMAGDTGLGFSPSYSMGIKIAYTTNPLVNDFTLKTIFNTQNGFSYIHTCESTGMIYANGKYVIICNLLSEGSTIGKGYGSIYSSTIDGKYTVNTNYRGGNISISNPVYDEKTGLMYALQYPTNSSYQGYWHMTAFNNLDTLQPFSSIKYDDETHNPVDVTSFSGTVGSFYKLDNGYWVFLCNRGSPTNISSFVFEATTNGIKKIGNPGTISSNGETYPLSENSVTMGGTEGYLASSSYWNGSNYVLCYYILKKSNFNYFSLLYSVTTSFPYLGFGKAIFISDDNSACYFFRNVDKNNIEIYATKSVKFLPTITTDGCNTFIRALN